MMSELLNVLAVFWESYTNSGPYQGTTVPLETSMGGDYEDRYSHPLLPQQYTHGINATFWRAGDHTLPTRAAFWRMRRYITGKGLLLPVLIGFEELGEEGKTTPSPFVADIAKMPHMLVAGLSGSGKTNFMRQLILSLVINTTPKILELSILDGSGLDYPAFAPLTGFRRSGYLYASGGAMPLDEDGRADPKCKVRKLLTKMERAIDITSKSLAKAHCINLKQYNVKNPNDMLPYRVLFVDEAARYLRDDWLLRKFIRIGNEGRKMGIHMIIGTQRPDAKVFKGLLKNNMGATAMLRVRDNVNERIISGRKNTNKATELKDGEVIYSIDGDLKPLQSLHMPPNVYEPMIRNILGYALMS